MGLKSAQRLHSSKEFSRVFQQTERRVRGRGFRLLATGAGGQGPRLGLVTGRRAMRRAVDRNRCRRVVREVFRRRAAELPAWDILFVANPNSAHMLKAAFFSEVSAALNKIAAQDPQTHS